MNSSSPEMQLLIQKKKETGFLKENTAHFSILSLINLGESYKPICVLYQPRDQNSYLVFILDLLLERPTLKMIARSFVSQLIQIVRQTVSNKAETSRDIWGV